MLLFVVVTLSVNSNCNIQYRRLADIFIHTPRNRDTLFDDSKLGLEHYEIPFAATVLKCDVCPHRCQKRSLQRGAFVANYFEPQFVQFFD
jgi:hypothetical protein